MNRKSNTVALLGWLVFLALAPVAHAQKRPYIGYVYPAGGQQATTFQVRLGGQDLDGVNTVLVTGPGVTARVVEYYRRLGNQEVQLLNEQLKELQRVPAAAPAMAPAMAAENPMMMAAMEEDKAPAEGKDEPGETLIAKIEQRTREAVATPACASLANLVLLDVAIAPDAPPGLRELRLVTPRGVSNPLQFHVGQVPEATRKPMLSASLQVLGKEAAALRKRPPEEAEVRITLPCTVNGQIASGEINRYRFQASQGQRLVLATQARQLIPYLADAVPGWFQPVLALYDSSGKELAYADDYRFNPDPVLLYQVPVDGEYVVAIRDAIYRGREDFVYRITAGELPFVTSIFPLGGPAGAALPPPAMAGWGLAGGELEKPPSNAGAGLVPLAATKAGHRSNRVPLALDTLPEVADHEPNDSAATAQLVALPVIVNGRIERPGDWDVFQFTGKAADPLVIAVQARRLDSPLDSLIKLTDANGKVLAFNDDCEDLTAGTNTHHADSYLMTRLPADGTYFVHLGDTARNGGEEYGYRLRLSVPQPDFELRVVPSSVSIPLKSSATVSVYAVRKDGFIGPIKLSLIDPPPGITTAPVVIPENQMLAKLTLKGGPAPMTAPVRLSISGSAMPGTQEIVREAVPAEDRMQAFLWRHLVPADDLLALVFDPKYQAPPKRVVPVRPPPAEVPPPVATTTPTPGTPDVPAVAPPAAAKPKFTKQQITGRLRQLKLLYEEGLLTDAFYDQKVTECEAGQ
ncbi:MAG: hypothetical protein NTW21_00735 [Verrucomicrobia bacterium]|nr:hypothetical protein [Verrucomicrobiota bacterium]